jgi:PAS domain S-box-containing protein
MAMKTILLVSPDTTLIERFRAALPDHGLLWVPKADTAPDVAQSGHVDVCVWDASSTASDDSWAIFANQLRHSAPSVPVVAVTDEDLRPPALFMLSRKASTEEIRTRLAAALEYRLTQALTALLATPTRPEAKIAPQGSPPLAGGVLTAFSRAFASVLEPSRALEAFLNAVADLVRPARLGVFLRDTATARFNLAAMRGFSRSSDPAIKFSSRLVHWLTTEGRPVSIDALPPDVSHELARFNAVIAIPLIADGHMLGILALGPPVVRQAYADHDLEILYELGMHLALALRAAEFHRDLEDQKRLAESVVAHMASGIIILGRDERIVSINHRAAEILGLDAGAVRGAGIRALPSPLGDLLVAAFRSTPTREELQLPGKGTWVAVATAPVPGDGAPRAAVLTLEDISAQRAIAERQRLTEQMDLLTAIVSRIADEIKNPLVSVRIFSELLPERYDDPAFRKEFGTVVARDVQRLVGILEMLTALVNAPQTHARALDLNAIIHDVARQAAGQLAFDVVDIAVEPSGTATMVTADEGQLTYALTVLIDFLASHSPPGARRITISANRGNERYVVLRVESSTAIVPTEQLHSLLDPLAMVHLGLRDLGPAVAARIVNSAGGSLRCDQERTGLVFRLNVPVH